MVALMGLSGAGKTTLLDILTGREKVGKVSGKVGMVVDGHQVPRRTSGFCSYVPSDADQLLMATQTVYEYVYFSAALRLPPAENDARRLHLKVLVKTRNAHMYFIGPAAGHAASRHEYILYLLL